MIACLADVVCGRISIGYEKMVSAGEYIEAI